MTEPAAVDLNRPPPPPHIVVEAERLARHIATALPWPAPCLQCAASFAEHAPDCALAAEALRTFREELAYLDAHPEETTRRRPMTEAEIRVYYGEIGISLPEPPDGFVYEMSGELVVTMTSAQDYDVKCLDVDVVLTSHRYLYAFAPYTIEDGLGQTTPATE